MAKKTLASSEYLRIRRYVLVLARESGAKTVRLPTNQELADKFGVSRPTVMKAMQALIRDGYVTGHRGIGTFTNPEQFFRGPEKNVGFLFGDGMYVWYDSFSARFFGRIMLALSHLECATQILSFSSGSADELDEELKLQHFDALVCVSPNKEILKCLSAFPGMKDKILLVNSESTIFPGVTPDFDTLGYELGKELIAGGCRKPFLPYNVPPWNTPYAGFVRAFKEKRIRISEKQFAGKDFPEIVAALKENPAADSIFMPLALPEQLAEIVKDAGRKRKDFALAGTTLTGQLPEGYHGYAYTFPFEETAEAVERELQKIFEGKKASSSRIRIVFKKKKGIRV